MLSFMADIGHFPLTIHYSQVLFVLICVAPTATWQSRTQATNKSNNLHVSCLTQTSYKIYEGVKNW